MWGDCILRSKQRVILFLACDASICTKFSHWNLCSNSVLNNIFLNAEKREKNRFRATLENVSHWPWFDAGGYFASLPQSAHVCNIPLHDTKCVKHLFSFYDDHVTVPNYDLEKQGADSVRISDLTDQTVGTLQQYHHIICTVNGLEPDLTTYKLIE